MAPGDTQEVVVGVVGGLGSDRLSSVAVMKFNDEFVQNTYNALFAVPKAPPQPDVKIAELNEKIVLEWSSNEQRVTDIEEVISPARVVRVRRVQRVSTPQRRGVARGCEAAGHVRPSDRSGDHP